jgi:pilus assembly protein CpaB
MNRTTRTFIVLTVAVLVAGVASYAVYRAVLSIPVRQVEVAQVRVAVAAKPINVGTLITPDMVKLVGWPAASPVSDAFPTVAAVVNRGAIVSIGQNEPITESKLAPREAGAGMAPTIPPGMRALAVKVDEVVGVAGFVVPGTRVDVLATLSSYEAGMTRIVASNVQVLTAGTKYDQDATTKDAKPIPTTVVTLAVLPVDAERIALAQAEGKLMLALRNPLDVAPTVTPGVQLTSLFGPGAAATPPAEKAAPVSRRVTAAPRPAEPAPAPPKAYTVETIRAGKRTEETVK